MLFAVILFGTNKIVSSKKLLDDHGNWAMGINLPSLKLGQGETLKREAFARWCFNQIAYVLGAIWLIINISYYAVEFKVLNESTAGIIFSVFTVIFVLVFIIRLYSVKRYRDKFIIKDEENEKINNE
jgi:uncharacterized membrane protein